MVVGSLGYTTKESASMVSGKEKVICARLYGQRMLHSKQAHDEQQIHVVNEMHRETKLQL
ncbi:hypothetical protein BDR04DRAFT_1090373 [Suillus decipiens]|nr:hypothetical protein BDR04DRAFT_1090373 [Suillus decipiens]